MKILLVIFLVGLYASTSCNKTEIDVSNTKNKKLKSIFYSRDTTGLLCTGCSMEITQKAEHFFYDNLGRLISRVLTTTRHTNTPATTDTNEIYSYTYSGISLTNYTQQQNNITVNHLLTYDLRNRLIKDSVINPEVFNNKVSYFTYLRDTIIQTNYFSDAIVSTISRDTIVIKGKNIIKEKIKTIANGTVNYREINYSLSNYQNPLSYVNNFSLLSSDYKNGNNFYLFLINTPQNVTYNLASRVSVTYWSNVSQPITYSTSFTIALDLMGRVSTVNNINNNKQTLYTYY